MYQDPAIPSLLRLTCCAILGQGDGEYLAFAKEGVEIAEQNLVRRSSVGPGSRLTVRYRRLTWTRRLCKRYSEKPKGSLKTPKSAKKKMSRAPMPGMRLTRKQSPLELSLPTRRLQQQTRTVSDPAKCRPLHPVRTRWEARVH